MNSVEYEAASAFEGWSHYFAAAALNDDSESDCWVDYYNSLNWNNVGGNDCIDDCLTDCESGADDITVSTANYLTNECGVSTSNVNRGTDYDWLRFYWDLHTDEGLTTGDIGDVIAASDAANWHRTDTDTGLDVTNDLQNAATAVGVGSAWSAQAATNGVAR